MAVTKKTSRLSNLNLLALRQEAKKKGDTKKFEKISRLIQGNIKAGETRGLSENQLTKGLSVLQEGGSIKKGTKIASAKTLTPAQKAVIKKAKASKAPAQQKEADEFKKLQFKEKQRRAKRFTDKVLKAKRRLAR